MADSGNPAESAGVLVHEPQELANVRYDREQELLVDLDTGDRLAVTSDHGGSPGQFGLSNEKAGVIAGGSYYWWSDRGLAVYKIVGLTVPGPGLPYLSRSEFDISHLAELFRARFDVLFPGHGRQVLVVDARPEKASEIDRRTGNRIEVASETSRGKE